MMMEPRTMKGCEAMNASMESVPTPVAAAPVPTTHVSTHMPATAGKRDT